GRVHDYPRFKLVINRLANLFIKLLFGLDYNDVTNAFKGYRTYVLQGCQPLLSPHFNLTVELPLKAIVRGYSYKVVPITWRSRRHGVSALHLEEQGSRYLYIVLNVWLERLLTRGDYRRVDGPPTQPISGREPVEAQRSAG
ncbi:MAG TPA: glycosyl transferase, partial [Chloroflexota bacterium]|nr:glycosyl transferase [Chloroflexota bacterium]